MTAGPNCGSRPNIRKLPSTADVIDLERHDVGVGVGRNTAIEAAETEFIFLLDDDHVVTQGSTSQLESTSDFKNTTSTSSAYGRAEVEGHYCSSHR